MGTLLSILLALLIVSTAFVIIYDNGSAGTKISWLLILTILPGLGIALYILFGINYRHHYFFSRRHKVAFDKLINEADENLKRVISDAPDLSGVDPGFRPLHDLMMGCTGGFPMTDNNNLEIITSGARKMQLLTEDIKNAKQSIHVEYFHFGRDEGSKVIRDLLAKKAAEGVEVRFINENVANFPIPSAYYNQMKRSGIDVVRFTNPKKGIINLVTKLNYRNHRKIVVIDGKIAYTGGMNINNHYFYEWRDTHLRITGGAVASLQTVFLDSWLTSGGTLSRPLTSYYDLNESKKGKQVQIVADEPNGLWPVIQMSYEWLLYNAKSYVWLQTPYFAPPSEVLCALKSAALRGVDVRLMLPKKVDTPLMTQANHAYYSECLAAGVKIYERNGEFIHSKTFVADDYLSMIGTANIDFRSFNINYEDNVYIYDKETAAEVKAIFLKDLENCDEVKEQEWQKRKWYQNLLPRIMRLFEGLL